MKMFRPVYSVVIGLESSDTRVTWHSKEEVQGNHVTTIRNTRSTERKEERKEREKGVI
jgi:hypothetical protein